MNFPISHSSLLSQFFIGSVREALIFYLSRSSKDRGALCWLVGLTTDVIQKVMRGGGLRENAENVWPIVQRMGSYSLA